MINYVYDGSFEGLLTAIYDSYYNHEILDDIVSSKNFQESFLYDTKFITTDNEKYKKVYNSIRQKISQQALENAYYAFLSELDHSPYWIYRYLNFGWRVGKDVDSYITDDRVLNVHKASQKVTYENHRMLGLLRFKKIAGGIYYASIEPDHNILPILSPHFSERFSNQRWIIHDIRRNIASIYDKINYTIVEASYNNSALFNPNTIKEEGSNYDYLWKLYFKHIAIPSRKNLKLQKQHMPMRYWHHLTEKN